MLNYPIKNILVPVDFSENSWNALCYAAELFKQVRCDFYVLHVADLREMEIDAARLFSIPKSFQKAEKVDKKVLMTAFLTKASHHLRNKKHRFFSQIEHGSLIDSVKKQLSEKNIDLITMGTRGTGTLKNKVIGSNAGAIITRIRCNTLVVPEMAKFYSLKNITFPTDFNIFYTPRILKSLSEILDLNKSNLGVVHFANGKGEENFTEDQTNTKAFLLDYLDEVHPGRNSYQVVRNKKMINAIQDFVKEEKIDMIAIIARNLNFLQQLFFDSRVERISFHTTVPMFIIHE
ncbi:universal stress protein [Flagellimonas allohymeniacidonis]|uniref:Universal stress protein n=1 Tax=Flagellimonas allohymeniacidonis TaxID=2517819 RepID=A0A4Q8QLL6_9FLAO|nr:universal stress protein [Allomuricauda hymeniacidonis]TAI49743.1 universal stress protein [Allomuricauda hymeniacidonis]